MKKYRVLITDGLNPVGIDLLKTHPEIHFELHESITPSELKKKIPGFQVLVTRNAEINVSVFEAAADLRLIVHTGNDARETIDIESAKKKSVAILSSAASGSLSVAEHTLSLLLSLTRHTHRNSALLKAGKWSPTCGTELHGKVLGVLGLGHVGKIVAEKAMALGMQVIAYDPLYPSISLLPKKFKMLEMRFTLAGRPDEVFRHADFLSLHISHEKNSPAALSKSEIAKMKDGAVLLCLSNPATFDSEAVLDALNTGKISGFAIDLPSEADSKILKNLIDHNCVLATSALATETKDAAERIAAQAAEQVLVFVNTGMKRETLN